MKKNTLSNIHKYYIFNIRFSKAKHEWKKGVGNSFVLLSDIKCHLIFDKFDIKCHCKILKGYLDIVLKRWA